MHDYDLRTIDVLPALPSVEEFTRVATGAFVQAGRHVHTGHLLPHLLAAAGAGAPDGIDVAGRLESLASAGAMLVAVYRSVLPVALELGLTTEDESEAWFAAIARDMAEHGDRPALWPLLIRAWERKPAAA
jgi:hypothetical protein